MKTYFELQIKINPELEDVIAELLFEHLDCEGIVLAEETYKDLEMISTTEGTLKVFLRTVDFSTLDNILTEIHQNLVDNGLSDEELGSWDYTLSEKPNEDWSKKWKEKWDITHVTDNITVVPEWLEYQPKSDTEVVIRLEPGCAFGTGTHQTTQLCMKAIEKYMPKNSHVADIGTGSGILSICAKKFGAEKVYGCDNDDTVIDVAKENARKNNVDCIFEFGTSDKISDSFDFICANILHNVLDEIMGDLKRLLKPNGILSLSGILDEKRDIVMNAIQREGLILLEEMHQDQWVGLVVKR